MFIMLIILIIGMYSMIKIIENGIPKLLKRKRKEWEEEINIAKTKKLYEHQQNFEIQKIVSEEKKRTYLENKKIIYRDNIRKGRDYEIYIIDYFRKQGYQTKGHGLLNGRADKGIDVIVKKDKEITLIQCKNWKKDSRYKIKHKELKEFLGNTTAFLEKNRGKAEGYTIKRLYVTSNDILDNSARYFLRENSIVEHLVIPMAV